MEYKCEKCKKTITLQNYTMIVKNGRVIIKEVECCDSQMKATTENIGMPTIIVNEN